MREQVEKQFGFLKTTAIGGLVFLLPLIVVGALAAQAWGIVEGVAAVVSDVLGIHTFGGWAAAIAIALGIVVAACFLCGVIARRSFGRWFTEKAERTLIMLFPRYAVFKDQLAGSLGGELARKRLKPVVLRCGDYDQLALEVERRDDGTVTVYLPSAPDPWTGRVVIASSEDLTPIDAELSEVLETFETLGRGTQKYVPPKSKQ